MKRNTRIIQISGIRGLLMVIFAVTCLAAGFIGFPAIVAMYQFRLLVNGKVCYFGQLLQFLDSL